MAVKALAQLKLKTLNRAALRALTQLEQAEGELQLQSHYHVAGSLEEHVAKIRAAFRTWRGAQKDTDFRWSIVLAVMADTVIFYTDNYYSEDLCRYFRLNFTAGDEITMIGEPIEVDVKIVVEELGYEAEQSIMDKNKQSNTEVAQDAVTLTKVVDTAAEAGPLSPEPAVPGATDANGPASVEDPTAIAAGGGRETAGPGVAADAPAPAATSIVKDELGKDAGPLQTLERNADNLLQATAFDRHGEAISWIAEITQSEQDSKGLVKIKGIGTRGDILNKNKQVYPTKIWENNIADMNKQAVAGKFFGKVEHPDQERGLQDVGIVFQKFWMQGSDLWFEATIVPSDQGGGNHLAALMRAGAQIDMSTRGYGTVKQGDWRGNKDVLIVQDDFVCTAIDAVWHGASTGSRVTEVIQSAEEIQAGNDATNNSNRGENNNMQQQATDKTEVQSANDKVRVLADARTLNEARVELIAQARSQLTETGLEALKQALNDTKTAEELVTTHEIMLALLMKAFAKGDDSAAVTQSETYAPRTYLKQSAEELAPKTVGELFQNMTRHLPDTYAGQQTDFAGQVPNHLTSPRKAVQQILANTARMKVPGTFDGGSAARALLAVEQGRIDVARDILDQAADAGATLSTGNADPGGAPTSNLYIFPLIVRVYPRLILNEIASIQPLDRPEAKIFYLDHYRYGDPSGSTRKRLDLNTSSNPLNSSFANDPGEGADAKMIQMELSSRSIEATTKKLQAQFTIEQAQDLMAYHQMDAAQVLLQGIAREMANEWNMEVLNDMLAQATGSALTYNKTAPTGFTQPEWDRYIWSYITKMSTDVFTYRNGGVTHLVCGTDAALALSKSMTFQAADIQDGNIEMYPGLEIFPIGVAPNGSRYRILKTNFWNQGSNKTKILGIRKGQEFFDTAYVFAPYADYLAPTFTHPGNFSQRLGLMSRAAKTVVVPEAMGYIDVATGTGVPL